nr:2,3-dihydro-2,3-dihydroxybenzoate dehydrogenase [Rummeliibacillus sp. SL167]
MVGKVVLVVGGAKGIGGEVVEQVSNFFDDVVVFDYNKSELEKRTAKMLEKGKKIHAYSVDIRNRQKVQTVIQQVEEEIGAIHTLIHVAGILHEGTLCDFGEEEWDDLFDINVKGVFHVTQAVSRYMKERHEGVIVTVGSNAASVPRLGIGAYGASKAAAIMYMKSLGLELAPYNIRCNVVSPGSTYTDMQTSLWTDESSEQKVIEGNLENYKVGIPLKKIAKPSDIVGVILFLISEYSNHITMSNIVVDGGATLGSYA